MFREPIRTINVTQYGSLVLPENSGAWIVNDTENRALLIRYKDVGTHFNIEDFEHMGEEAVDWLAARIYGIMEDAYVAGEKSSMSEVNKKLSGLKSLLT